MQEEKIIRVSKITYPVRIRSDILQVVKPLTAMIFLLSAFHHVLLAQFPYPAHLTSPLNQAVRPSHEEKTHCPTLENGSFSFIKGS